MALVGAVHRTPFGALSVITDEGIVVSAGFQSLEESAARIGITHVKRGRQDEIAAAVAAYADGEIDAITAVATRQPGAAFAQAAWKAMTRIRAGRVLTYAELAAKAGSPLAVRAAGSACARNLVAPFVPCHRIVRTGGALGNYGYGVDVKQALLRHEGFLS
jgi:methylated-DNA-[protein]-cysteine S-methyltransferase